MDTLTILVMGKCGVGKSSTINSIIGERVVTVSAFQVYGPIAVFFFCMEICCCMILEEIVACYVSRKLLDL